MKKLLTVLLVLVAVAVTALVLVDREERRLRILYHQLEDRLNLRKNKMTVDF